MMLPNEIWKSERALTVSNRTSNRYILKGISHSLTIITHQQFDQSVVERCSVAIMPLLHSSNNVVKYSSKQVCAGGECSVLYLGHTKMPLVWQCNAH